MRHNAVPGPQHWDWRCLACDGEVADRAAHRPWWKRWGK